MGRVEEVRMVMKQLPGRNVVLDPWMEVLAKTVEFEKEKINEAIMRGELEKYEQYDRAIRVGFSRTTFIIAANIAKLLSYFIPDPAVYYFGIGHQAVNLDIIGPLLFTDFSVLYGTDIVSTSFVLFREAVGENLSVIPTINPNDITFIEHARDTYEARFLYHGKERRVRCLFGFDARFGVPDLWRENPPCVIFTRRTGQLFSQIDPRMKTTLFNLLSPNGFLILDRWFLDRESKKYLPSASFLHIDLASLFGFDPVFMEAFERITLIMKSKRP